MRRIPKLGDLLLWGGLERETYSALRPAIWEENRVMLLNVSVIAAAIFAILAAASPFLNGAVNSNTTLYIVSAAVMLVLYLLARTLGEKYPVSV